MRRFARATKSGVFPSAESLFISAPGILRSEDIIVSAPVTATKHSALVIDAAIFSSQALGTNAFVLISLIASGGATDPCTYFVIRLRA